MAISSAALIDKFIYALNNNWGYIWGQSGTTWTKNDQEKLVAKYNSDPTKYTSYKLGALHGAKWIGHKVADCSGLFCWAFKQLGGKIYHGSNTIWKSYCSSQGTLKNGKRSDGKTLKPGTAVFKTQDTNDRYHIGLYVGGSKVIEAQGTVAGVVSSNISKWNEWGELKDVVYSDTVPSPTPSGGNAKLKGTCVVDVPNDGTVNVRTSKSTSSNKVTVLREGEKVDVVEDDGTWCKVNIQATGYIMSKYLREGES